MPVQFTFGEIAGLFHHFRMQPVKKGSKVYDGLGKDGIVRRSVLHAHSSGETVAIGTADQIAKQLHFNSVLEMRKYMDDNLK